MTVGSGIFASVGLLVAAGIFFLGLAGKNGWLSFLGLFVGFIVFSFVGAALDQ